MPKITFQMEDGQTLTVESEKVSPSVLENLKKTARSFSVEGGERQPEDLPQGQGPGLFQTFRMPDGKSISVDPGTLRPEQLEALRSLSAGSGSTEEEREATIRDRLLGAFLGAGAGAVGGGGVGALAGGALGAMFPPMTKGDIVSQLAFSAIPGGKLANLVPGGAANPTIRQLMAKIGLSAVEGATSATLADMLKQGVDTGKVQANPGAALTGGLLGGAGGALSHTASHLFRKAPGPRFTGLTKELAETELAAKKPKPGAAPKEEYVFDPYRTEEQRLPASKAAKVVRTYKEAEKAAEKTREELAQMESLEKITRDAYEKRIPAAQELRSAKVREIAELESERQRLEEHARKISNLRNSQKRLEKLNSEIEGISAKMKTGTEEMKKLDDELASIRKSLAFEPNTSSETRFNLDLTQKRIQKAHTENLLNQVKEASDKFSPEVRQIFESSDSKRILRNMYETQDDTFLAAMKTFSPAGREKIMRNMVEEYFRRSVDERGLPINALREWNSGFGAKVARIYGDAGAERMREVIEKITNQTNLAVSTGKMVNSAIHHAVAILMFTNPDAVTQRLGTKASIVGTAYGAMHMWKLANAAAADPRIHSDLMRFMNSPRTATIDQIRNILSTGKSAPKVAAGIVAGTAVLEKDFPYLAKFFKEEGNIMSPEETAKYIQAQAELERRERAEQAAEQQVEEQEMALPQVGPAPR